MIRNPWIRWAQVPPVLPDFQKFSAAAAILKIMSAAAIGTLWKSRYIFFHMTRSHAVRLAERMAGKWEAKNKLRYFLGRLTMISKSNTNLKNKWGQVHDSH